MFPGMENRSHLFQGFLFFFLLKPVHKGQEGWLKSPIIISGSFLLPIVSLEMSSVQVGEVILKGIEAKRYIAMSSTGSLYTTVS